MFGLSTWEIILIAAVALIFIGPDQLPKVARQVGKGLRQMRGAVSKVDGEVRRAVREATAEAEAALDEGDGDDDAHMDMKGPRPDKPTPGSPPIAPTTANAPPAPPGPAGLATRDWKEAVKAPVEGRVPMTQPARPGAPAPSDASPGDATKASAPDATTPRGEPIA